MGAIPTRASTAPRADIPDVVRRAEAAFNRGVHGVVGMQRHFQTNISAGPVHHSETSESGIVLQDGKELGIRYYSIVQDGKPFSQSRIDQRNDQTNRDWAAGKVFFKEPYDPRFIGDYTFAGPEACADCSQGALSVTFSSDVKDTQHGNGTMLIDEKTARVLRLTYTPNALPPHASSGSVVETTSAVLGSAWYVTRIEQTYHGKALFLSGTGTFTGTFDHFRRYATAAEGLTSLKGQDV